MCKKVEVNLVSKKSKKKSFISSRLYTTFFATTTFFILRIYYVCMQYAVHFSKKILFRDSFFSILFFAAGLADKKTSFTPQPFFITYAVEKEYS